MRDPGFIGQDNSAANYDNPRGLPQAWIDCYLARDRSLLALDVMRAFDQTSKMHRKLQLADLKIWILLLLLAGQGTVIGWLLKIVLTR